MVIATADEVEVRPARHLLHLQIDSSFADLRLRGFGDLTPRVAERGQYE
jgi:hypothetical protein